MLQKLRIVNDKKKKKKKKQQKIHLLLKEKKKMGKLNTYTKLITIYIQILKIFCFFNQFIVVTSLRPFIF
jgi:hypothetical protein